MARLVIRNRDKVNRESVHLDACCLKRGMVVDILPDGKSLGKVGDTYTGWTVVDVPRTDAEMLSAFLGPELGDRRFDPMLQRRAFVFDLDTYAALRKSTITLKEALSLKLPVVKRTDPSIL